MGIRLRYLDCLHYSDGTGYLTFYCQNVVTTPECLRDKVRLEFETDYSVTISLIYLEGD